MAIALSVLAIAGCEATVSPAPGTDAIGTGLPASGPTASGGRPSGEPGSGGTGSSSQALIAADLAAGTITPGQALQYRAWALFWDPRLPERYDGKGSFGEDHQLFEDIAGALPSLDAQQRAALEPYLRRPTDPASAWSAPAPSAGGGPVPVSVAMAEAFTRCTSPRSWYSLAWSPDADPDRGVKAFACAPSASVAQPDLQRVLDMAARLWPRMTAPSPSGMGKPIPDLHEGDGKVDVYLLEPLAECRDRGDQCEDIGGNGVAAQVQDVPSTCAVAGHPARGCTGYMLLGRQRLQTPSFAGDFAHEFFHLLQAAHNGSLGEHWYVEASASWAEWEFVARDGAATQEERDASKSNVWQLFEYFQDRPQSLLQFNASMNDNGDSWQNQAWVWPLFQSIQAGPGAIYLAWRGLEDVDSRAEADRVIDAALSFADNFGEFATWNAQPERYLPLDSTGLEEVTWQEKPNLGSLPYKRHKTTNTALAVVMGELSPNLDVEPLAAQYDTFTVPDGNIRQVTIDVRNVANASNADLRVLAQLNRPAGDPDTWRVAKSMDGRVTLCRDSASDDARSFEVVIANHDFTREGDLIPPSAKLTGSYTVEGKDRCDVPDGFEVTFSGSDSRGNTWNGTATFELRGIQDSPSMFDCQATPDYVPYCYLFVKGQASWTHVAIGNEAPDCVGTAGGPLSPAMGDFGELVLVVRHDGRADWAMTYQGMLKAAGSVKINGLCEAGNQVISWMSISAPKGLPAITPGYHLSGTRRIDCGAGCGHQEWTWDLRPVFRE